MAKSIPQTKFTNQFSSFPKIEDENLSNVMKSPDEVKTEPQTQSTDPSFRDFHFDELFIPGIQHETVPAIEESEAENSDDDEEDSEGTLEPENSKVNLDSFKILNMVGKGAYGKVYQVQRIKTKEIWAMKVLRKDYLIKKNCVESTKTEKDVLRRVKHPFIVTLHFAFQNESRLYLVMDYLNGGQLFYHLREEAMFTEKQVKFYAAEVFLALQHLHSRNIIHRDLKPENILLDRQGHVILTDFGFAKDCISDDGKAKTFCGTAEYMAPEMINRSGCGKAADWWSFGILIYDMLTGAPPFRAKNESLLFKKILNDKVKLPTYLTSQAHSLIKGLLTKQPSKRLGSGPEGSKEISSHPFFKGILWNKMLRRELDPPFVPSIPKGDWDVSNFEKEITDLPVSETPVEPLSSSQENLFKGFSYVRSPSFGVTH